MTIIIQGPNKSEIALPEIRLGTECLLMVRSKRVTEWTFIIVMAILITTLHQITKGKRASDVLGPFFRILQTSPRLNQLPGQELGLVISGPEGRGSRTTVRVEWSGLEGEREECLVSNLEPLRRHDAQVSFPV